MGERSELICSIKITVVTGIPSGRKKPCRDRKRAKARGWQLNLEMIRENKSERNSREGRAKKKKKKSLESSYCCWAGSFGGDKKY